MPIYDYQCTACGHKFDVIQSFKAAALTKCPLCGDEDKLRKLISAPAFHLKGTGWYVTDFKNPPSKSSSEAPISKEGEPKEASKQENTKKDELSQATKGEQSKDAKSPTTAKKESKAD
jgi:putative FmdB family regulatory protein